MSAPHQARSTSPAYQPLQGMQAIRFSPDMLHGLAVPQGRTMAVFALAGEHRAALFEDVRSVGTDQNVAAFAEGTKGAHAPFVLASTACAVGSDAAYLVRPYWSSKRTMSSSPR